MFAGKKSAQIREILISESAWEEMTCLFAPSLNAGSIMATKLVANEFVAMIELQKIAASMTPRGLGILSVFLVSFANFASIGIIAGAIKGLNEPQGNIVSRFGLRLVYSATLVSLLSASFAGLVL